MTIKFTITEKTLKDGKWSLKGTDGKFYSFWEQKKDGGETKAFEQFKKFQIDKGMTVDAEVKENPYTGKDGKPRIGLNIMYFKGDEQGTPYVQKATPTAEPVTRYEFNKLAQEVQMIGEELTGLRVAVQLKPKVAEEPRPELPPWLENPNG